MADKKRLIVAQDACKYAKDQLLKGKFNFEEYDAVIETINNTDTIDAVEVVHGRWIKQYNGIDYLPLYECSVCGKYWGDDMNFCGECGAKMDEERKEQ